MLKFARIMFMCVCVYMCDKNAEFHSGENWGKHQNRAHWLENAENFSDTTQKRLESYFLLVAFDIFSFVFFGSFIRSHQCAKFNFNYCSLCGAWAVCIPQNGYEWILSRENVVIFSFLIEIFLLILKQAEKKVLLLVAFVSVISMIVSHFEQQQQRLRRQ